MGKFRNVNDDPLKIGVPALQKLVAKWVAKTAFGGRFIDRLKHGGTLLQKSINSLGCVVVNP